MSSTDPLRIVEPRVITASCAFGLAVSVLAAGLFPFVGVGILLVLLPQVPFLLLQDTLRYLAFKRQKPELACLNDLVWVGLLCGALPLFTALFAGSHEPAGLLIACAWSGSGSLAAILTYLLLRPKFSNLRLSLAWIKIVTKRIGAWLCIETFVFTLSNHGVIFGLAFALGVSDLGVLRGTQLLLAPASTAFVAFNAFVLPKMASNASRLDHRLVLKINLAGIAFSTAAVSASVVASPIVAAIAFGRNLSPNGNALFFLALTTIFLSGSSGLILHLKVVGDVARYSIGRAVSGIGSVPIIIGLAYWHGVAGAACGFLVQALVFVVLDIRAWRLRGSGQFVQGAV